MMISITGLTIPSFLLYMLLLWVFLYCTKSKPNRRAGQGKTSGLGVQRQTWVVLQHTMDWAGVQLDTFVCIRGTGREGKAGR